MSSENWVMKSICTEGGLTKSFVRRMAALAYNILVPVIAANWSVLGICKELGFSVSKRFWHTRVYQSWCIRFGFSPLIKFFWNLRFCHHFIGHLLYIIAKAIYRASWICFLLSLYAVRHDLCGVSSELFKLLFINYWAVLNQNWCLASCKRGTRI